MKITALWERKAAHPRYGSVFILCQDGKFLCLTQEREFIGTDKNGERLHEETGQPEYSNAFDDKKYNFREADFYIRHFGGKLTKQWTA